MVSNDKNRHFVVFFLIFCSTIGTVIIIVCLYCRYGVSHPGLSVQGLSVNDRVKVRFIVDLK